MFEEWWLCEVVKEFEDMVVIFNISVVEDLDFMGDIEKWSGNCIVFMYGVNCSGGMVEFVGVNFGEV